MLTFTPDFALFGLTLLGVAVFRRHTLPVALAGLVIIAGYKALFSGFQGAKGLPALLGHFAHEWVLLADLLGLLVGFAILARHFEHSRLALLLPGRLPNDWRGAFLLLIAVFLLSGLLDNIAGAMVGGAVAGQLYRGKVHPGFLVAVVVASNAGGAGSVVGDTTTTMIWLAGASPLQVVGAYLPAFVAAAFCSFFAARRQAAHAPMVDAAQEHIVPEWRHLAVVAAMLAAVIATNLTVNLQAPEMAHRFPFIGAALWGAILFSGWLARHDWGVLPHASRDALFLLALVASASMMPVEKLPPASWQTTLGLGFVSALFDNIPLTALAIRQGGYDWALLAYAVGFGGSMLWFGSTAGVALCSAYPEARSVTGWLRHGWFVLPAYLLGYFVLLGLFGWQPTSLARG